MQQARPRRRAEIVGGEDVTEDAVQPHQPVNGGRAHRTTAGPGEMAPPWEDVTPRTVPACLNPCLNPVSPREMVRIHLVCRSRRAAVKEPGPAAPTVETHRRRTSATARRLHEHGRAAADAVLFCTPQYAGALPEASRT